MSSTLEKFFPVSRLLRMPAVGIDISDYSIKYVEIARASHHQITIRQFGSVPLPSGVMENGVVMNENALRQALSHVAEKTKADFARFAFPDERGHLFHITIPKIPAEEIPGAVQFQLEEHIPMPADSVVFDYDLNEEQQRFFSLRITATQKDHVERYQRLLGESNLVPKFAELNSQSTARALTYGTQESNFLMVDFGEASTSISLVRNKAVVLTTTLSLGGRDITNRIAENLGLSFEEAEQLKTEGDQGSHKGAQDVLVASVKKLVGEIRRYYSYWQEQRQFFEGIEEHIIVVGGAARISGLVDAIEKSVKMKTTAALPQLNLRVQRGNKDEFIQQFTTYTTALGSALGDITYE